VLQPTMSSMGGTITDLDVAAEAADGVLSWIENVDNLPLPAPSAN
jgi:hypothetical protein